MKKIIYVAVMIVTATTSLKAQTRWGGAYTLKVEIKGSKDSVGLFYYDMALKKQIADRRKLQQGMVEFEGKINEPFIVTLYMGPTLKMSGGSHDSTLKMYLQGGTITVKGEHTFKDAAISGASITDDFAAIETAMNPYRKQLAALAAKAEGYRQQNNPVQLSVTGKMIDSLNSHLTLEVIPGIIKKYNQSPAGAYQLNNLLYNNYRGDMDTAVIIPLYNQLSPEVRELSVAKFIGDRISRVRKANLMTGRAAPDFTRPDINGKQLHLSDFRGKYVLIDFWGSWCHPCRKSHPHLKELYAKYKEKGLEIIGVDQEMAGDLEAMKKLWVKAVNEDGLPWVQVLNAEGVKEFNIVQEYGIEAFPTKILVDKEGEIIARFVGDKPELIEAKLTQLFGQ